MIKRGEIYWVNLDPTIGSEIHKSRPGLVVSNDINNVHSGTVTVVPITSNVSKVYPFEALLPAGSCGNNKGNKAMANQIRAVDKRRLGGLLGTAPEAVLKRIDAALRLHLGL